VHVVILVGRQPPYEMYVGPGIRKCFILGIKIAVFFARNWVVGIALGARILVNDARFVMFLPCEVFKFGNPRIGLLIRIIDHRRLLKLTLMMRFMFEFERAVRKFAIPVVEK